MTAIATRNKLREPRPAPSETQAAASTERVTRDTATLEERVTAIERGLAELTEQVKQLAFELGKPQAATQAERERLIPRREPPRSRMAGGPGGFYKQLVAEGHSAARASEMVAEVYPTWNHH